MNLKATSPCQIMQSLPCFLQSKDIIRMPGIYHKPERLTTSGLDQGSKVGIFLSGIKDMETQ